MADIIRSKQEAEAIVINVERLSDNHTHTHMHTDYILIKRQIPTSK